MKRFGKYRAVKAQCRAGHTHDSKREAIRCDELHILEAAGKISELIIGPQYWFVINGKQLKHANGRRVGYKSDFEYVENGVNDHRRCKGRDCERLAFAPRRLYRALPWPPAS
jgi:hypothetical protein